MRTLRILFVALCLLPAVDVAVAKRVARPRITINFAVLIMCLLFCLDVEQQAETSHLANAETRPNGRMAERPTGVILRINARESMLSFWDFAFIRPRANVPG